MDPSPPIAKEDIAAAKKALRATMRSHVAALSAEEHQAASAALCARLAAVQELIDARVLMATLPHRGEPDLSPFLREWMAGDPYRVLLMPRIVTDEGAPRMTLWVLPSLKSVCAGPHGVPEPDPARGAEPAPWGLGPAVALVPGLAFDKQGGRLGRGGGFFDALLAELGEATLRVGVCHDCQLVGAVTRDAHDVAMHAVATPEAWLVVG